MLAYQSAQTRLLAGSPVDQLAYQSARSNRTPCRWCERRTNLKYLTLPIDRFLKSTMEYLSKWGTGTAAEYNAIRFPLFHHEPWLKCFFLFQSVLRETCRSTRRSPWAAELNAFCYFSVLLCNGRNVSVFRFSVNTKYAGNGTLDVTVTGPSGRIIQSNIASIGEGLLEVSYIPTESGQHCANVLLNHEKVPGTSSG